MTMDRLSLVALCVVALVNRGALADSSAPRADQQGENLMVNGGFEQGAEGWSSFWARDTGSGEGKIDDSVHHGGKRAYSVKHTGEQDWSLTHSASLPVQPGEIFEFSAWIQLRGKGSATLGVVTRDKQGKVHAWSHGGVDVTETKGWQLVRTRFIVPAEIATIQPRVTGHGPSIAYLDDISLVRTGSLDSLRNKDLPTTVTTHNDMLEVTVRTADAALEVKDRRAKLQWRQRAGESPLIVLDAKTVASGINVRLLDPTSMREMAATVRLEKDRPEVIVSLQAEGEMEKTIHWPPPIASAKGESLILPVNEGISYPVDDLTLPEMHYYLYGGHGLCMPWYGAMKNNGAGWVAIVETADDAAVRIPRRDELLVLAPEWQSQKGQFGPARVIRYVFFDRGGYVAMAKRYREYSRKQGLFKTLAEKRKELPTVDMLVGAVNVWCWDSDAPAICRELQAAGIKRILWSNARPPEELQALNAMGVLTSRYDIFQDTMDPANFPRLHGVHRDWTTDAWKNDDLMIGANGEWVRGWKVKAKDGEMIPCGTLCDRQAVPYAERRIPEELKTHPYRCRFIDTTTASPWRECYHPKHPMTRTESKHYKMELLRYISEGCKLVCGSETGHDAAVPYAHYFEGMLSLGPYRVPDSGRNTSRIWDEVPEKVAKFQTGHGYRLPLWELVYHDCLIAQWYWGDYNNKLPKLWDRRDLWNALYGTPPMFMFSRKSWEANKDRFVKSYQVATPVARATGYAEMLSHEWLKGDRSVQRTRFANGVTVTVNFGESPWRLPNGKLLPPLRCFAEGL